MNEDGSDYSTATKLLALFFAFGGAILLIGLVVVLTLGCLVLL